MRKKLILLLTVVAAVGLMVVAVAGGASAGKPTKYAVCHYDNDGIPSAPKTLWLGSPKAVAQHVANHTIVNGHEGNDYAGVCA